MIIRCAECGGDHVYDLGMNVDKNAVDITPINNDEELNLNTLPYYIGGYYCADCQTFVSIIEEPEPADMKPISEKQKTFLQSLIKKLKIEEKRRYATIKPMEKRKKSEKGEELKMTARIMYLSAYSGEQQKFLERWYSICGNILESDCFK